MRYLTVMLIAWVPVVAVILGLLLWFVSANPKASEAGRIIFQCGVLVTLFVLARQTLRLG